MNMLANAARGLKNMWQSGDEDDYDDDLLDEADERQTTSSSTPRYSAPPSKYSSDKYSTPSYGGGDSHTARSRNLRTVPIPLRSREKNIYTLRPKNLDEAAIAADYLKSGSAVVMNLETVDNPVAVRIIDFMSGVCYGVEGQGHAMKLGDAIFLFTPTEYEIASDELDYGENRDFFFKNINGTGSNRAPVAQAQPPQPQQQPVQHPAQSPIAAHTQRGPVPSAVTAGMAPTVAPVRAQSSPHAAPATTPSGYATANYSAPAAPRAAQPAPVAQAAAPAPVSVASSPAPVAVASTTAVQLTPASTSTAPSTTTSLQGAASRTSTLPANSVYGSGGKAHVLIGGQSAPANTPAPPSQGGTSGGARSWDR